MLRCLVVAIHHHSHWALSQLDSTKSSNSISSVGSSGKPHSAPPLRAARVLVTNDRCIGDSADLLERATEHLVGHTPCEVANNDLEARGVLWLVYQGRVTATATLLAGCARFPSLAATSRLGLLVVKTDCDVAAFHLGPIAAGNQLLGS